MRSKIKQFDNQAATYVNSVHTLRAPQVSNIEEWDDLEDMDGDAHFQESSTTVVDLPQMEESVPPKNHPISLPSTLGCSLFDTGLPYEMASCEVDMRMGQANDALHDLRISIAHKSFLYRTQVRNNAPQQSYVTRSYGEVHNLQISIEQAAKTYRLSRSAMEKLGVSSSNLSKYQPLNKEDLRANTAVADSNAPGQRYDSLSWIWHTSVHSRNPAYLDECTSKPSFNIHDVI